MPKERDVIKILWQTFVSSLRPRQFRGNLIGKDSFGNKYFEIPADPSVGKRKDSRWFEPKVEDKFDQEMPAEWEAWLRGRRKEPPTEEELIRSQAIADMKKVNAAELDKEYSPQGAEKKPQIDTGIKDFPRYQEYELMPGESQDREPPQPPPKK